MKIAAIISLMLVITSNSFATNLVVSRACEDARKDAQENYRKAIEDINAGVKTGEITKKDARMYKSNASLILVSAEAFCHQEAAK